MAKKLRLTNGVSFGGKYTVTADDVAVVGVAEVLELTVTEGATKDGDIAISLRGAAPVEVTVTTAASTADAVAALIKDETYPGWEATVSGAVVTFTASAPGAKTGANTFDAGDTGVVAAIEVETPGVTATGGSVTFDFCSSQTDTPVDYDVAASFTVVDSSNVFQPLTDAVITYPAEGQVKLADGSNFKLTKDDIVYIVAQRAVEVE